MSYELRHGQSLSGNLQRICRKQIEQALAIADGADTSGSTPVHETRKCLKRARAALRLACTRLDAAFFREQNCALRKAGRFISEIRDAEVRLQTVRELERLGGRYQEVEAMLMMELQSFIAAFTEWQREVVPLLEKSHAAVERWPLSGFGSEECGRLVQRSYKRARRTLAHVQARRTAECFHELRSRAKMLC